MQAHAGLLLFWFMAPYFLEQIRCSLELTQASCRHYTPSTMDQLDSLDMSPGVVETLVANHRQFLQFLERRAGSRAEAEDILQEAFVKGIERAGSLADGESASAWFYRTLRNAVIDRYRRRGAADRALEAFVHELERAPQASPDLKQAVCACVGTLSATLKPEYAQALQRIDIDGISVQAYAAEVGIQPNNAGVRVHRARLALRARVMRSCGTCAEHGCLDCTC
jgi:RNA polymerase sigma factor (sigma-70 family)